MGQTGVKPPRGKNRLPVPPEAESTPEAASAAVEHRPECAAPRIVRSNAEIALLVSSYQRPWHLERVLASIAAQRGVLDRIEVVVTDDGSTDQTPQIVEQFARSVPFPVQFTTHEHTGFHLARCRNEGVRASRAPYLLFLDGDCLLPPDHVEKHLRCRKPRYALGTECYRLDREVTRQVDPSVVRSGGYLQWVSTRQRRKLTGRGYKCLLYQLLGHPTKPKLFGGNFAVWRSDYEQVNGYDENFRGWGCEDDDLRLRLRRSGVRSGSLLLQTRTVHLWHPPAPSTPQRWRDGANVAYLNRPFRLTCCASGLVKRSIDSLRLSVAGRPADPTLVRRFLGKRWHQVERQPEGNRRPEIELLFLPGKGRFSGRADCNILVVLEPVRCPRRVFRQVHITVAEMSLPGCPTGRVVHFRELDAALETVLEGPNEHTCPRHPSGNTQR